MTTIIDGKQLAKKTNEQTKMEVQHLKEMGITPGLAVVIVGNDEASQRYVRNKNKTAQRLGINSKVIELADTITETELIDIVQQLNDDDAINGILVQDPLPTHIDERKITRKIKPEKDVDGFHPYNVGKLFLDDTTNYPVACTPKGIMTMLKEYNIDLLGKKAVVIGRSAIVGKPMAALLLNAGASITVLHRYTTDILEYTKTADVIVAATGTLHLLQAKSIKKGAVIIDVGQNIDETGHLVGDVDYDDVFDRAGYITPVPGGVGPMTIATLMQQTVELTKWGLNSGK